MSEKPSYELSRDGLEKLEHWERARLRREKAERELASADCDLRNAENDLGKWMLPKAGANPGERFHIWLGDGLLEASCVQEGTYLVRWRQPQSPRQAVRI